MKKGTIANEIAALEARMIALEKEVALLKQQIAARATPETPRWRKIAGSFADDPMYEEAMRLGRAYRESLRPKPAPRKRTSQKKRSSA
jgi:hypothetical protein